MNKKVVITKIPITQPGEIKLFQVKIPRDAFRIIGINVTVSINILSVASEDVVIFPPDTPQWLDFIPSFFLGDLRMQSYGKANIFIAEDVYLKDSNIGQGDFTTISQFTPKDWSHKVKFKKVEALEDSDVTVLKGIYHDRQIGGKAGFSYTVGVYVWYELNSERV